jgi:2-methylcitrate dehydratase
MEMNDTAPGNAKAIDRLQERLASYACDLNYESLSDAAIHAAKVRIIDSLGALIGGFFGPPCRIARNVAAQIPSADGATVIGTRHKTTLDMAAFVNAATARFVEANDVYHWPGSSGGHPSDVMMPVLATAEHMQASGRDFITGVVLAYEIYLRIADAIRTPGFDSANFCCLGSAISASRLMRLSKEQVSHAISMAIVPNNMLKQVRTGHLTAWKAVAAGQASRSGVFAAILARAGMEGPHLPFEGKAGWFNHVARKPFSLETMGGNGVSFKVQDTLIKQRTSCATTISSILAAEKIAPLRNIRDVKKVTVEVYKHALESKATGEHNWNPDSRETADHSIPYVTAVTLMDGTVTPRQFSDARLSNPDLRALLQKVEVVSNDEFTKAYERIPVVHMTRVTVITNSGERLVGESGGDKGDLSEQKTDAQISDKFRGLTEEFVGAKKVNAILDRLWNIEKLHNVAEIPPAFILD